MLVLGNGGMAQSMVYGVTQRKGWSVSAAPRTKESQKIAVANQCRFVPFHTTCMTPCPMSFVIADREIVCGQNQGTSTHRCSAPATQSWMSANHRRNMPCLPKPANVAARSSSHRPCTSISSTPSSRPSQVATADGGVRQGTGRVEFALRLSLREEASTGGTGIRNQEGNHHGTTSHHHRLLVCLGVISAQAAEPTAPDPARAFGYLKQVCDIGPRISGTEGMARQQDLLAKHFSSLGGKVGFSGVGLPHPLTVQPVRLKNMIVSWHPKRPIASCSAATTRLPSLSLKSCSPATDSSFIGANDGGSGVAVLMELAHFLPTLP